MLKHGKHLKHLKHSKTMLWKVSKYGFTKKSINMQYVLCPQSCLHEWKPCPCLRWVGVYNHTCQTKLCCPARSIIIACLQIAKGPFSHAAFQPSSPIRALLLGKGSDHDQHIATLLAQVRLSIAALLRGALLGQRQSDSRYLSESSKQ